MLDYLPTDKSIRNDTLAPGDAEAALDRWMRWLDAKLAETNFRDSVDPVIRLNVSNMLTWIRAGRGPV